MAFIADHKSSYNLNADTIGTGFAEQPLTGVKTGDMLVMAWNANDDDIVTIDDAGWIEVSGTDPLNTYLETRVYYKFAIADNEQCSTWSSTVGLYVYMYTLAIRGVDPASPIVDGQATSFTGGSNTFVEYPAMTATADNQLAIYLSGSDADAISQGTTPSNALKLYGTYGTSDSIFYQRIVNTGAVANFFDSVPSDQTCASGFIVKDDPAGDELQPLDINPKKTLVDFPAVTHNDSGWESAVKASGVDLSTGLPFETNSAVPFYVAPANTWRVRVDNFSGVDFVQGDAITFASGETGTFHSVDKYTGTAGYMTVEGYSGSAFVNNEAVDADLTTAHCLVHATSATYYGDVTGFMRLGSYGNDVILTAGRLTDITGAASANLPDGKYFPAKHASMFAYNEGYWYSYYTDANAFLNATLVVLTPSSGTLDTVDNGMCVNDYVDSGTGGDYNYPRPGSGTYYWNVNITGNCRSFATPVDFSGDILGIMSRARSSSNVKETLFLVIDSNDNWKLWRLWARGGQTVTPELSLIDLNSVDTPIRTSGSFDPTIVKYYGIIGRANSSANRDLMYTYEQYTMQTISVTGGGIDRPVEWRDIDAILSGDSDNFGTFLTETVQSIVASQFVLATNLQFGDGATHTYMGMANQALSFPPQADGVNNFLWNIDGGVGGITLDTVDGFATNSLISSEKGHYYSGINDSVDYTGTLHIKATFVMDNGKTYSGVSFVECPQVIHNSAVVDNCTFSGHSGNGALKLDGTLIGGTFKDNSNGIEIDTVGEYTMNNLQLSGNTYDINVTAVSGTVTINTNVSMTYQTAGATVIINNDIPISVTALNDGSPIEGARVYLIATGNGPIADDTVILDDFTDSNGIATVSMPYGGNQDIVGRVRKGTASPLYKTAEVVGTITSTGFSYTALMVSDD